MKPKIAAKKSKKKRKKIIKKPKRKRKKVSKKGSREHCTICERQVYAPYSCSDEYVLVYGEWPGNMHEYPDQACETCVRDALVGTLENKEVQEKIRRKFYSKLVYLVDTLGRL